jgi:hypothetical protein
MTSRIMVPIALILMIHGWLIESTPMMVDGVIAIFISIFIRSIERNSEKESEDGK